MPDEVPPKDAAGGEPERRAFFRRGLKTLLRSVVEFNEALNEPPPQPQAIRRFLRPPGARPEPEFLDTCYRCGSCVDACPANAIRRMPSADEQLVNTPFIDPDLSACTACRDVTCTISCPSGALVQIDDPLLIRIGQAEVFYDTCVRTAGKECTKCLEVCPVGEAAISINAIGRVEVHSEACTGCGQCQFYCPTRPRAIRVRPI